MIPSTDDLRDAPELAALVALDAVLVMAARALRAQHPSIRHGCLPDGRSLPVLRAAAAAHDGIRELRRELRRYRAALDALLDDVDDDDAIF